MDDYKDEERVEKTTKQSIDNDEEIIGKIDITQMVNAIENKIYQHDAHVYNFIRNNLGNIFPKVDNSFINIILGISDYSIDQSVKIWDYILSGTKDNLDVISSINIAEYFISLMPHSLGVSAQLIEFDSNFQKDFIQNGVLEKIYECTQSGQYALPISIFLENLSKGFLGDYEIHDCLFAVLEYLIEYDDEILFHTLNSIRNICKYSKYRGFEFTPLIFSAFDRSLESKELLIAALNTLSISVTLDQDTKFDTEVVYEKMLELLSADDEDIVLASLDFVESIIVDISRETQPDSNVIDKILECATEGTLKIKGSSTMILAEMFKVCVDECAIYLLENELIPLVIEIFDYGNNEQKSESLTSLRRIQTLYDDIPDELLDQLKQLYDVICEYDFEDDFINQSIMLLKHLLDSYCLLD